MSNIHSSLFSIQHYLEIKGTQLSKSQLKQARLEARTAFKALEKSLSKDEWNSNLSIEFLNSHSIQNTLMAYLDTKPKISLVTQVMLRIIGKNQKQARAEKLQTKINSMIRQDSINRRAAISEFFLSAATKSDDELRESARSLIMSLVTGKGQIRSSLFLTVLSELKSQAQADPKILAILNHPNLFSSVEIKTGVLRANLLPTIELCIHRKLEDATGNILDPVITSHQEIIKALRKQRLFRLNHLNEVYSQIHQDPGQRINGKFFPPTHGWYVGSCRKTGEAPFELEMQAIGARHGVTVISDSQKQELVDVKHALILQDELDAAYPQDFVDFSQDEIRIPLLKDERYGHLVEDAVRQDRQNRDPDWSRIEHPQGGSMLAPHQTIGMVGQVWDNDQALKAIALASAIDATIVMSLTYSEGGNTLIGSREDESPYIIIGKDSYAASKSLMEKDLGKVMTDEEVKKAFAIDYGVKIEDLFFVEQPGDFHLDMNMAIVGMHTIILNDAVLAARDFEADLEVWLREERGVRAPETIQLVKNEAMAKARIKKLFEDKTEQDLKNQGFNTIRVAGRFNYKAPFSPEIPVMNFFNTVTATTPDNQKIIVAMGVIDDTYKQKFIHMINQGGVAVDEIHFLSMESTKVSLAKDGGISCRTKTM